MTYPKSYNAWSGNPAGVKPDLTRCCEEVRNAPGLGWGSHQCGRKRGHGPEGAYCKQHDPEAVQARKDESHRKHVEAHNSNRYMFHGRSFYAVLKLIAEGHNDPGALARETIARFHEGESK